MAIQSINLDPQAQSYTNDQIVGMVNSGTIQVIRTGAVAAAARLINSGEIGAAQIALGAVTAGVLASGVAKANLDSMTDVGRGYIKTNPTSGQFKVVSIERQGDGKVKLDFDDVQV